MRDDVKHFVMDDAVMVPPGKIISQLPGPSGLSPVGPSGPRQKKNCLDGSDPKIWFSDARITQRRRRRVQSLPMNPSFRLFSDLLLSFLFSVRTYARLVHEMAW